MTTGTSISTDTSVSTGTAAFADTLRAAKRPIAAPAAGAIGVVLALLVVAGGVVLGRDVLIGTNALDGAQWLPPAADWLDGLTAQQWMLPAGIGAVVVGLLVLFAALKPRRRTHRPTTMPGVWIRDADVVRLARIAASERPAVDSVTATGRTRSVRLSVVTPPGSDTETVRSDVRSAVEASLSSLARPPKIVVKTKTAKTTKTAETRTGVEK